MTTTKKRTTKAKPETTPTTPVRSFGSKPQPKRAEETFEVGGVAFYAAPVSLGEMMAMTTAVRGLDDLEAFTGAMQFLAGFLNARAVVPRVRSVAEVTDLMGGTQGEVSNTLEALMGYISSELISEA